MVKNLPANAGDPGSIRGSGRFPGGGNGNPLPYSCLGNPMDREVWWATVHGVAKSQTWLRDWACTHTHTLTHTHPSGWLQLFYLLCFVFKRAFKVHVNLFSPVWKCSGTCGHSVICPWGWSWPSQLQKLSSLIPKPEVTSSFFAQWQFLVFSPTWCLYTVVCC